MNMPEQEKVYKYALNFPLVYACRCMRCPRLLNLELAQACRLAQLYFFALALLGQGTKASQVQPRANKRETSRRRDST